jgi:hypothetical protein
MPENSGTGIWEAKLRYGDGEGRHLPGMNCAWNFNNVDVADQKMASWRVIGS